jgi:hypothetical protein
MPDVVHSLSLADGSRWEVAAGDEEAASIVSQLASAMRLRMAAGAIEPMNHDNPCRLFVQVDGRTFPADCYVPSASERDGAVTCILSPSDYWGGPYINLLRLSLVFARHAQARGGVLLHGALAERDGLGVILTAPSGTGKTTASHRLPDPWRSLCDDTTLVVRDAQGRYWAHPWPTWSRFLDGGPGGAWGVEDAVPLKGVFFLAQAMDDQAERLGPGQAVSMLMEYVAQVSADMAPGLGKEKLRALHLERFDNLCALARMIPAYVLHISLTGAFWQEMERALSRGSWDEA